MTRALASVIFILINEFIKYDNKWARMWDSIYHIKRSNAFKTYFFSSRAICILRQNATLFTVTSSQMTSFCTQRHAASLGERGSKIDNTLVYYRKLSHGFITLPEGVLCVKEIYIWVAKAIRNHSKVFIWWKSI